MTVYEKAPVPEDLPEALSEEDLQKIAETSQKLIERDQSVQATCVALLYAQQLYHAGLASLRHRCEELGYEDRHVEAHLIASMKEASLRPFSREELIKKTQAMILPWLAAEVSAERERERQEQAKQESQLEDSRRQEKFLLPWPAGEDRDWFLDKDHGLVLVGTSESLKQGLEEVLRRARAEQITGRRFVIAHLQAGQDANVALSKRDRGKLDYLPISPGHWVGKLGSEKKVSKVLGPWLKYARKHRIDLLLIDDIRQAAEPISSAVAPSQHLQANYRLLLRWCHTAGAFLVGGSVFEEEPDYGESAWELLDARSELRFIQRLEDEVKLETYMTRKNRHADSE